MRKGTKVRDGNRRRMIRGREEGRKEGRKEGRSDNT